MTLFLNCKKKIPNERWGSQRADRNTSKLELVFEPWEFSVPSGRSDVAENVEKGLYTYTLCTDLIPHT